MSGKGSSGDWDRFCADAWTDDWVELCEALGVDWRGLHESDVNSRQLRKVVQAWANEYGRDRVEAAIRRIR